MKYKKGDTVIIRSGKDQGKKGKIEKVFSKTDMVQVSGVNLFKRHLKKKGDKSKSGIIQLIKPLPAGKVSLVCPNCAKITRIGFISVKQEKVRFCKKCKQPIA